MTPALVSAPLLRRAAGFMPAGVALVSHGDVVLTVSTLQCVSFDPPIVSVCFESTSRKGQAITDAGRFTARLLRSDESGAARDAALPSTRPLVELDCAITRTVPVGDHHLVLADVLRVGFGDGTPLVYWRRGFQALRPDYPFLASREAFATFIRAWELTTLPRAQWTHAAHVAVAACYAVRHGSLALDLTRQGIRRYNEAVGTANTDSSGYHETLTRFWADVVARLVAGVTDEWAAARTAVERYGEDRDLHVLCYAFDVPRSVEARRQWVPPDQPIGDALT